MKGGRAIEGTDCSVLVSVRVPRFGKPVSSPGEIKRLCTREAAELWCPGGVNPRLFASPILESRCLNSNPLGIGCDKVTHHNIHCIKKAL